MLYYLTPNLRARGNKLVITPNKQFRYIYNTPIYSWLLANIPGCTFKRFGSLPLINHGRCFQALSYWMISICKLLRFKSSGLSIDL